jgi:uncharacterized protein with HEPN domain
LPSRSKGLLLQDILESIDHIREFLGTMTYDAYLSDRRTQSAVERELLIIAEAAKLLGPDAEQLGADHDWGGLRRMGDLLRHVYHRVDDEIVWDTAKIDLPELRVVIVAALQDTQAH